MSGSINLGIPDIAVVLRENTDTNNVVLDVPNISVTVEHAPDYKVSVQPSSLIVHRTGSLPSIAVSALTASYALSASYIAGGTVTSASYALHADSASLATTASYALNAQGTGFPFSGSAVITGSLVVTGTVSASSITGSFSGDGSQLTGIATTLRITGSTGQDSIDLKTQGLLVTGSNGITTTVTDNTVTIAAPPGTVTASAQINVFNTTGGDNVATLGANTFNGKQTIFGDLEIDTGNIVVTSGNSLIVSGAIFAQNEFIGGFVSSSRIESPSITGSLLGTASVADNIDIIFAGGFETGSDTPIVLQLGGTGNVISASYALTASYASNNNLPPGVLSSSTQIIYTQIPNIPLGTISSSTQFNTLSNTSASYALTASYALNSITINTSSFATTGSNTFIGNQIITGSLIVSGSSTFTNIGPAVFSGSVTSVGGITGSFSGSLSGTITSASFATTASAATSITFIPTTASFATTASYALNAGQNIPAGTVSSSAQYPGWVTASSQIDYNSITNKLSGVISSSTQFNALTNTSASFATTASFALNAGQNIPAGTVSSSTQVVASLPIGVISSSTQLPAGTVSSSAQINTGSFSGSFTGSLTGTITSASFATTASYALSAIAITPAGTVSSSAQYPGWVTASSQIVWSSVNYNTGIVSSSAQVTPLLPVGTVSSSIQVSAITASLATTSSNTFIGNQTISGSTTVTGSLTVGSVATISSSLTANSSSLILNSGSNFYLQNNGIAEITGSLLVSGSVTITTGSVTMPNRPAFRVTGTGGATLATTVLSGSKLNTPDFNQGNHFNTTTGLFTAPIAGLYQVNLVVRTNSNTNSTINQAIVYKSSSTGDTPQVMVEFGINTTMNHAGGSTITNMAVGDTLRTVIAVGTCSFDVNDNFSVAYIG